MDNYTITMKKIFYLIPLIVLIGCKRVQIDENTMAAQPIQKEYPIKYEIYFKPELNHVVDSIVNADNLIPETGWLKYEFYADKATNVIRTEEWRQYRNGDTISILTKVDNTDLSYRRFFLRDK